MPGFSLTSPAFGPGESIPSRYTCDGEDISPALAWQGTPANATSFALIVDDPDAPGGIFTHWVLYNLPASEQQLAEAVPKSERLENGALQGRNSFGRVGYGGPCPPQGKPHRYQFRLYALDAKLGLPAGASKEQVIGAMRPHVLAQAELTGIYQRKAR